MSRFPEQLPKVTPLEGEDDPSAYATLDRQATRSFKSSTPIQRSDEELLTLPKAAKRTCPRSTAPACEPGETVTSGGAVYGRGEGAAEAGATNSVDAATNIDATTMVLERAMKNPRDEIVNGLSRQKSWWQSTPLEKYEFFFSSVILTKSKSE
jgi:hypothetical protein